MPTDVDPHESQQVRNAAEELVKAYIAAYETKDATAYLSLFSKGAVYVDFAVQVHAKIRQLKEELVSSFRRQGFQFSIRSYFVSVDGRLAALQGRYRDSLRSGQSASVPIASFLEIHEGKITREALYYDGSQFKRELHVA